MTRNLFIAILLCLLSACQSETHKPANPSKALHALFSRYWEERMHLFPLEATAIGDNRFNDQLPITISDSYRTKIKTFYTKYLDEIKAIHEDLSIEDELNRDIFCYEMQINLDALQFPSHLMPINQFWSFTLEFPQLGSGTGNQPFKNVADYDNFLHRMKQFPAWADTAIVNMRRGISLQITLPKALAVKVIPQLEQVIVKDTKQSLFYGPITHFPDNMADSAKQRLALAYQQAIDSCIQPAYTQLAQFFKTEYLPACRNSTGISEIPDGAKYYSFLIQQYTTTHLSADSIYQLGLKEVDSLQNEMEKVKTAVQFKGSLSDFFTYINKDRQFYPFHTAKEVLDSFWSVKHTEEAKLKLLFETEPKTKFEIRQTEAFRAASASAEYNAGSEDGTRPGIFYTPILNPREFNAVGMETLFLHEAIPGHHYQISLQQENTGLPKFRKFLGYSAYAEGWALYTETLGKQLGLFGNPYQYLGHLSDAMHRAIRLVVDAGMHARHMSREEAIAYMLAHERATEAEATAEIERYMAIPGQALSYKIGQITISRIKATCQQKLGQKFNIRKFHTQVLEGGNMPLDLLEKKLYAWVNSR